MPRFSLLSRKSILTQIALLQLLFLLAQVFIFYPCLGGAPALPAELRDGYSPNSNHNRQKRAVMSQHIYNNSDVKGQAIVPGPMVFSPPGGKYEASWKSIETRPIPQWFEDAKFGIFLHWGVYSVPSFVGAGTGGLAEWFWYYHNNGKPSAQYHTKKAINSVHVFVKKNYPPKQQYTDFAPQFTAEFFDPDHWADVFQQAGARYMVLTSKHHDGFTLWGSKKSWNWNAVENGPHRDLVGDLQKSVTRRTKLKFGLYHSAYEWFNPLYLEDKKNKFRTQHYIKDKLHPELHDMVNTYKPDIVWSDGAWDAPSSYWNSTEFIAWLYNDSPVKDTVVTNDRWGSDATCKHGGYLTCDDRYNPGKDGKMQKRKWENCMTIDRESWGYRRNARLGDYYDMDGLTEILIQTVSYGGNLLMNIGPTGDGRIPPIFEERLLQMGDWLKVNGDAIYGTRMWHTPQEKLNKKVYYTKKSEGSDGSVIYALLLDWPDNDILELSAPHTTDSTLVTWSGYKGNIEWKARSDGGIAITLPRINLSSIPCRWAWTFKLAKLANIDV